MRRSEAAAERADRRELPALFKRPRRVKVNLLRDGVEGAPLERGDALHELEAPRHGERGLALIEAVDLRQALALLYTG